MEGLLKLRILGPSPKVSDPVGLGRCLRVCISNKFPRDADTPGPGTTLENRQSEKAEPASALAVRMPGKYRGIWAKGVADGIIRDVPTASSVLFTEVVVPLLGSYLRGRVCLKEAF